MDNELTLTSIFPAAPHNGLHTSNLGVNRSLELINTWYYIARMFFPGIVLAVAQHPNLVHFGRLLVGATLAMKIIFGNPSVLLKRLSSIPTMLFCSVSIDACEAPYHDLQRYLSTKRTFKLNSTNFGETLREMRWNDRDPRIYRRENLNKRSVILFQDSKVEMFMHNGRTFFLTMSIARFQCWKPVKIWTFGRCVAPIRELLDHVSQHSDPLEQKTTNLYVGSPTGYRSWRYSYSKPSRPIETVDLDEAKKTQLLGDIEEFLREETRVWYQDRSIPYRRGYLFHGESLNVNQRPLH
jgi:hypothetical protein